MKTILVILLSVFIDYSYLTRSIDTTLNYCCDIGNIWNVENKSCNITLSFPLPNVATEHNSICLTTVGACCLRSLRETRCNEGKQVGLNNGICNVKGQPGKNQVDFMMCCEICKIGIAVALTKTNCQSIPFFYNHQWGTVYQSCCNSEASNKEKLIAIYKNPCIDGTHDCKVTEKCITTPNGFECQSQQSPSPLLMFPKNVILNKNKQNCSIGYEFDSFEKQCKDINECIKRPCDINELCENTNGSFKCHCKNGFQLDQVTNACTDINECQLNTHTCQEFQRCDNTIGSYQCVRITGCGTGYTLDVESALCIDDDECLLKTDTCGALGPDWVCRNTQGSFRCEKKRCLGQNCRVQSGNNIYNNINVTQVATKCLRGFKTDNYNKCIDINECLVSNRCLKNEICVNTNGSYYCLPKSRITAL
ncbi:EGF-type aspartate/asparagine hydroxylation site,EGF-like calcium-binding domain,EGF-like calcium- [Cinara cedri]|uniref:EGF-type aspartate/asparagine hydroxylation site,EGF-like calcium-binding domain,EGF-like calcium n=1 Tax=Cinara cedri TaxID=506608 RepID=A0A5E4NNM4_9HEMI|nr:EGF-type aspartate/asparagine hydroxylation site,EGF-like calcium-binding domain,EGF-like calcium- [Cinara cedri]